MGDVGDGFEGWSEKNQHRKEWRRGMRTGAIMALADEGFTVRRLTPYQFRIDGILDLYPTNGKWHDLRTGKRGQAWDLAGFARKYLAKTDNGGKR